jgi:hypothetical protein
MNQGRLGRHITGTGLAAFTLFHVALSLVGIFAGIAVLFALLSAKQSSGWTSIVLGVLAAKRFPAEAMHAA